MPLAAAICLAALPSDVPDVPGVRWPSLVPVARSAAGFAPPGWRVERVVAGHLDGQGATDLVAVLRGNDPACRIARDTGDTLDTNPRILIVARGTADGRYRLALANHDVIPRTDDPYADDPFEAEDSLTIASRAIRLSLTSWRSAGGWATWTTKLAFRWDGTGFALIGVDRYETQRNSGETETLSANFLTGRMRIETGSIEDDAPHSARWSKLPARRPPPLERFGDGLDYDPREPSGG